MNPEKKQRLKELLLKFSYQKREVRLASGRLSDFYFDGKQTTLHPEGGSLVGEWMAELIQEKFPEAQAVGGPTLGADPITSVVSLMAYARAFPLFGFIVRKEPKGHGTMSWIEGASHLQAGMRVVLVEDVITTGGSILKAWRVVREAGLVPLGVLVVVDREEGGKEALEAEGLKVFSLFTKSELLA
ncbi:MAG TPA: orotate phosphoribosyltransferase [Deltaproteobacteria bacterium]|nr:orotate phosphoribosyltransferase [Deltaproteobacteria bacterium]